MSTIASAQVMRLRTTTFGPEPDQPVACDGSYCCPCADHVAQREGDVARGVRPRMKQPWQPKAPRRLRVAA